MKGFIAFKRIVSLLMTIILLFQTIPIIASADNAYSVTFSVMGKDAQDNFRKWASDLLKYYREEYACVDSDNTFVLNTRRYEYYFNVNGDDRYWKYETGLREEAALYHPYYRLADRKTAYNISENIYGFMGAAKNLYNNNIGTIAYRETFLNEEERRDLYMWMLKETLSEKVMIDPSFFKLSNNDRKSSFSIKEGKLVKDTQLTGTIKYSERDAAQKITDYLIDAYDLALQTWLEKKRIEDKAKKIVNDSVDSAMKDAMNLTNSKDYIKKWKEKMIVSLQDNLASELFDALRDINELISDNDKKQIQLLMRNSMAEELAAEAADLNNKAIDYMRTTYGTSRSIALGNVSEYEIAANKVISKLESDEITELIADSAMEEVTKKVSETIMAEYETFIEGILTEKELGLAIAQNIIGHVIAYVEATLKACATEGLKQLEDYIRDKIKGTSLRGQFKAMLTELTDFIDKDIIQDLIIARIFAAISSVKIEKYIVKDKGEGNESGSEEKKKDLVQELSKALNEQFDGNESKQIEPLTTALKNKMISFCYKELMYFVLGKMYKQEDQKKEENKGAASLVSALQTDSKPNDPIVVIVLSMIRAILASFKNVVDNEITISARSGKIAHLSKENTMEYDRISKLIDETMEGWSEVAADDESDITHKADAIAKTLEAITLVSIWVASLDDEDKTYIVDALLNGGVVDYVEEAIKELATDTSFSDIIFQIVFGQKTDKKIEEDAKQIVKDYQNGKYGNDYYSFESTGNFIKQKVAGEIDSNQKEIEDAVTVIQKIWDKCFAVADSSMKASLSLVTLMTGEHSASLSAERARVVANESRKIENAIVSCTNRDRMDLVDYDEEKLKRDIINNDNFNIYTMSAGDILDPQITPDIERIKMLTNMILLQMHLDAVGMGSLINVIAQRQTYYLTSLYGIYLSSDAYKSYDNRTTEIPEPPSVLLEENTVEELYKKIVENIDRFEDSRPRI